MGCRVILVNTNGPKQLDTVFKRNLKVYKWWLELLLQMNIAGGCIDMCEKCPWQDHFWNCHSFHSLVWQQSYCTTRSQASRRGNFSFRNKNTIFIFAYYFWTDLDFTLSLQKFLLFLSWTKSCFWACNVNCCVTDRWVWI